MPSPTIRHRLLLGLALLLVLWGALVAGVVALQHQQRERVAATQERLSLLAGLQDMQGALAATQRPLNRYADTRREGLKADFIERVAAYEQAVAALLARQGLGEAAARELTTVHGLAADIRASGLSVFQASEPATIRSLVAVTRSFVHLARDKGERVIRLARLAARERTAAAGDAVRGATLGLLAGAGLGALLLTGAVLGLLAGIRWRMAGYGSSLEAVVEGLERTEPEVGAAGPARQRAQRLRAQRLRGEARRGAGELVRLLEGLDGASAGPAQPGRNLAGARGALATVAAEARSLAEEPPPGGNTAGLVEGAKWLRDLAETAQVALQEAESHPGSDTEGLQHHAKEAGQALAAVAEEAGRLRRDLATDAGSAEAGETAARLRELSAALRREG